MHFGSLFAGQTSGLEFGHSPDRICQCTKQAQIGQLTSSLHSLAQPTSFSGHLEMPDRYLFPCPFCEQSIPLTLTQAGRELRCQHCQKMVQTPSMGGIRKLPLEEGASGAVKQSRRSGFSPLQGWLFAGGLTLAVLAGIASYTLYQYASSLRVKIDIEEVIAKEQMMVDQMAPAEVYVVAAAAKEADFALEYREPEYRASDKQGEILSTVSYGLAGLSGLGLLMVLGSLLFGNKRG